MYFEPSIMCISKECNTVHTTLIFHGHQILIYNYILMCLKSCVFHLKKIVIQSLSTIGCGNFEVHGHLKHFQNVDTLNLY
jgi:hypothetical protein